MPSNKATCRLRGMFMQTLASGRTSTPKLFTMEKTHITAFRRTYECLAKAWKLQEAPRSTKEGPPRSFTKLYHSLVCLWPRFLSIASFRGSRILPGNTLRNCDALHSTPGTCSTSFCTVTLGNVQAQHIWTLGNEPCNKLSQFSRDPMSKKASIATPGTAESSRRHTWVQSTQWEPLRKPNTTNRASAANCSTRLSPQKERKRVRIQLCCHLSFS